MDRSAVLAGALLLAAVGLCGAPRAAAQAPSLAGVTIKSVEFRGLRGVGEAFARRTIKTTAGQPYRPELAQEDVRALLRTRKFLSAVVSVRSEDGQAVVIFTVQEKPEITGVLVEGNKKLKTSELMKVITVAANTPLDRFEITRSRDNIERKYKEAGYYYAQVTVDADALEREDRVIFRIVEGPRVRVRKIVLEGNRSFPEPTLRNKIRTQTAFWFIIPGAFDEEQADRDAAELQTFYRDEGFLDARVGYRLDFTNVERTDLTLVFVIEEGVRYRVRDIRIAGNEVFSTDTLLETMKLKPGNIAREQMLRDDAKRIEDRYGEIGFVAARVEANYEFLEEPALVDIKVVIVENERSRFGRITIRGNLRTRDEVIRRELRFYPEEDYNTLKARAAEKRLTDTTIFKKATITPMQDVDGLREALVEVEEADAITFLIGAGVSTDNGLLGSITFENRNFDLFNWPRTWGEFFRGQSFRGAGQRLKVVFEPGTELFRFRIDFTEPYLFDRPLRLDLSLYAFSRNRGPYQETRFGFIPALGHRFESGFMAGWAVEGALRFEYVDIGDVQPFASKTIREVQGGNFLSTIKGTIVRDTTDSRLVPSEGYRFTFSWEQAFGDFTFGKPIASFVKYWTISTDSFDRKSVLALRADAGYIVGDAPVFEKFYAGGIGSLRGFAYRGVTPRGGINEHQPIGGNFLLLAGGEYSFPIYAKNVRGVLFLDMGTVEEDITITAWRATVGVGLRVNLEFFGPIPLIFDLGMPFSSDENDQKQVFNFSFGASF